MTTRDKSNCKRRHDLSGVAVLVCSLSIVAVFVTPTRAAAGPDALAKLMASDGGDNDQFGGSVDVCGDTVVIGATWDDDAGYNSGSAYVFVRDCAGAWTQQAKLTAADAAAGDYFGSSVAISGNTVIVGAWDDDDAGRSSGSAYIFTHDECGLWTQQAKLTASDAAEGERFGFTVAIDGDTAVASAQGNSGAGLEAGAVYVFTRDTLGSWTQQAKLVAADGTAYDEFGLETVISGDTMAVGAHLNDGAADRSGSVYIFTRDDLGTWTQQHKLTAWDAEADDYFGSSIALSHDTLMVGAWGVDSDGVVDGSVYVFVREQSGSWGPQAKLISPDTEDGTRFGTAVAVSGDMAVIGTYYHAGGQCGCADIFARNAFGKWQHRAKLAPAGRIATRPVWHRAHTGWRHGRDWRAINRRVGRRRGGGVRV